jgi:hypothetical protein
MRTYEQSCALLDLIVGRCVRDADFADAVLSEPESALAVYCLEDHELADFRALAARHHQEAREGWRALRTATAPLFQAGGCAFRDIARQEESDSLGT